MPPLFIKGYSVDMTGLVSWCRECVVGSRVAPSRRRAGGCAACRRSTRWRRRRSPRQTSSPFSATTPRSRCRSCLSPSTGTSTGPVSSHCTYLHTYIYIFYFSSNPEHTTSVRNTSLMRGRLPASQKHAIVTPRLKRSGLDPTDIANFRPVSNLTFTSKVIERAAASQLNTYLSANGLMPRHQSAYRKKHYRLKQPCYASGLMC